MVNLGRLERIIKPNVYAVFCVSILKFLFWLLLLTLINNILVYYCLKNNSALTVPDFILTMTYLFYVPLSVIHIIHKTLVFKSKVESKYTIELYENGIKINDFNSHYKDLQLKVYPAFVDKKLLFSNNRSKKIFKQFITEQQVKFISDRIKFG